MCGKLITLELSQNLKETARNMRETIHKCFHSKSPHNSPFSEMSPHTPHNTAFVSVSRLNLSNIPRGPKHFWWEGSFIKLSAALLYIPPGPGSGVAGQPGVSQSSHTGRQSEIRTRPRYRGGHFSWQQDHENVPLVQIPRFTPGHCIAGRNVFI